MLTSLALIFLVGLSAAAICGRLRLPRIIGMLFTGIILGPHVLGLLDDKILSISSELRQMALIIILLKAGLSLNLADLKKVGRPAVMMSFVPASFEICGYLLCAPMILGITRIEAAVMGAVVGYFLGLFFETAYAKAHYVRNSMKVMIVLGVSFLLMAVEAW